MADGRTLFVAETYRHHLWKGEYDPAKGLPLPFAELGGPVGPHGIALSDDGALYVAVFGQGAIKRVTPDGLVSVVTRPGEQSINCAFDRKGKLGLVVTEASTGSAISQPTLVP
ncbi:MAG: SMP-30/gluconolactonase/LRE family protein [Cypionkella sp.]